MPFVYIGIGIAIFLINCVIIYYLFIRNKTKKEAKQNEEKEKEEKEKKEEIDELDASYIEYKYCRKEKLFKEPKDEE